jgi:tRNA U55 pseudouridine synthase TruB
MRLRGCVALHKPQALSSAAAVDAAKPAIRAAAAAAAAALSALSAAASPLPAAKPKGPPVGHNGTLDPAATGLLALLVGSATRAAPLCAGNKRYAARVVVGRRTDTGDIDSNATVTHTRDCSALRAEAVSEAAAAMVGAAEQTPPVYSAIGLEGKPLHQWAREGHVRLPRCRCHAALIPAPPQDAAELLSRVPKRRVDIFELRVANFTAGPAPTVRQSDSSRMHPCCASPEPAV